MTAEGRGARRATSADVAEHAGVSRSTVSQILNGDERFPLKTRERVHAAAAALDYRPSRAGRALVTGLSDIVVIVVPNATFGPHLQDSVDRITNASAMSGMSVVVRFGAPDESTLASVLDLRPAAVVDMGVFTDAQRARIEAIGCRVVPPRLPVAEGQDADPIDIHIGRLQVQELTRAGVRDIVYARLEDGRLDPFGPPRLEGIRRESSARGLDDPEVIRIPLRLDEAVAALAPLATQRRARPLGVCAYNDDVAIAVLAAARHLGMSVPADISVIGVDNTAVGQLLSPRLTTIDVDQPALMDALTQELAHLRRPQASAPAAKTEPSSYVTVVRGETTQY